MLQQGFRRSSAQNHGLEGDFRLKSGEPAAVPTAVGVHKTETWLGPQSTIGVHYLRSPKLPSEQRYKTMHYINITFGTCGDMSSSGRLCRTVDTKIEF